MRQNLTTLAAVMVANNDAEAIAEIVKYCADEVRWLGLEPRVALLSHSNFGSSDSPSALKMRKALELLKERLPELEVEGEMHADLALSESLRNERFLNSCLQGKANLQVMPNQDAANYCIQYAQGAG